MANETRRETVKDFEHAQTRFGFKWGPLEVTRLFSDPRIGVVIAVKAGADEYEIRASPSGRRLEAIKLDRKPADSRRGADSEPRRGMGGQ